MTNTNRCKTCRCWLAPVNQPSYVTDGVCNHPEITDNISPEVDSGWEGHTIIDIETDENFGCILHER